MDIFSQKKMFVRLTATLTILNICMIGYIIWKSVGVSGRNKNCNESSEQYHDVSKVLVNELGLDEQQADKIKQIREDFYQKEIALGGILKGERDSMNSEMFNKNTNEEELKSLARSVSENEYKMELLRIEQAQQLKAICTPQQLEKLNSIVIEIRDYFRPDNRFNGKRPGRQ